MPDIATLCAQLLAKAAGVLVLIVSLAWPSKPDSALWDPKAFDSAFARAEHMADSLYSPLLLNDGQLMLRCVTGSLFLCDLARSKQTALPFTVGPLDQVTLSFDRAQIIVAHGTDDRDFHPTPTRVTTYDRDGHVLAKDSFPSESYCISPLPRGRGFVFINKSVGGSEEEQRYGLFLKTSAGTASLCDNFVSMHALAISESGHAGLFLGESDDGQVGLWRADLSGQAKPKLLASSADAFAAVPDSDQIVYSSSSDPSASTINILRGATGECMWSSAYKGRVVYLGTSDDMKSLLVISDLDIDSNTYQPLHIHAIDPLTKRTTDHPISPICSNAQSRQGAIGLAKTR